MLYHSISGHSYSCLESAGPVPRGVYNKVFTMKHFTFSNIYAITSVAVVGGGLFGFDISSMSGVLGTAGYKCYFNQGPSGPPFNDSENCSGPKSLVQDGITASMAAGSWLGALFSGYVSDSLGRRKAIIIGCLFWYVTLGWPRGGRFR
jgi:hypothetical protein